MTKETVTFSSPENYAVLQVVTRAMRMYGVSGSSISMTITTEATIKWELTVEGDPEWVEQFVAGYQKEIDSNSLPHERYARSARSLPSAGELLIVHLVGPDFTGSVADIAAMIDYSKLLRVRNFETRIEPTFGDSQPICRTNIHCLRQDQADSEGISRFMKRAQKFASDHGFRIEAQAGPSKIIELSSDLATDHIKQISMPPKFARTKPYKISNINTADKKPMDAELFSEETEICSTSPDHNSSNPYLLVENDNVDSHPVDQNTNDSEESISTTVSESRLDISNTPTAKPAPKAWRGLVRWKSKVSNASKIESDSDEIWRN
ncbi:MAG: hypothetical protein ACSHX5_04050 [Phycisphaerales bacterium]